MNKYFQVFKISFQQESVYKVTFLMWRLRNVFQILVAYFLWQTIFSIPNSIFFGFNRNQIMTYVFGVIVVRSLVLSARAMDISNDISDGNLSNHLLKPVSYFNFWITRDLSNKTLNILFALIEFFVLLVILKPELYIQKDVVTILASMFSIIMASLIYFTILFITSSIPFWAPELGWASQFLVGVVIVEFLSGAVFPINILPESIANVVMLSPFPYMIYFPIQVYLGNISGPILIKYFLIAAIWVTILLYAMKNIWSKGLKAYQSTGK